VFVLKTFALVPMALQQTEQIVPPTVLIFVRLVPVIITKLPTTHALDALRVALDSQKRLIALRHRIVFVLKTFALVPMALQQTEQIVPPTELIFVRRVPVGITRPATTPALKTFVPVPMVLQQTEQIVPPPEQIFVRLVPVDITRPATHALVALRVALEQEKRLLVLRHRIVFVLRTIVPVPMVMQQRARHVLPTMLIFVRRVPVDITRLATPVQNSFVLILEM